MYKILIRLLQTGFSKVTHFVIVGQKADDCRQIEKYIELGLIVLVNTHNINYKFCYWRTSGP